jgi:serine/threonine-protein kinase
VQNNMISMVLRGEGAYNAYIWFPRYLAYADGGLYLVETEYAQIYRMDTGNGSLTHLVGNGVSYTNTPYPAYPGDGTAASSLPMRYPPAGMAVHNGELYFSHRGYQRVFKLSGGSITTVAGNGSTGGAGDEGLAVSASLNNPAGLAFGPSGTLYIADAYNHTVRAVDAEGIIHTVAGTAGIGGNSGDGGPPQAARLSTPVALAFGPDGSLYISDWGNHHIRRVRNLE